MSQAELQAQREAITELRRQLAAAEAAERELARIEAERRAEAERLELLKKPIVIQITQISGSTIVTESDYRPDIVEFWKTVPGRSFKGYTYGADRRGRNAVPARDWQDTAQRLMQLPFVSIEWLSGTREELDWVLSAPAWHVDFNGSHFIVKPGPNQSRYSFHSVPGSEYDYSLRSYSVPMMEGFRVYERLEELDGVVYSEAASSVILGQIESRSKLDRIALQTDTDFITDINGKNLRPFQRVGVEYIHASGGQLILADDTGLGKTRQFLAFAELKRREAQANGINKFQCLIIGRPSLLPNLRREVMLVTGETPHLCVTGKPNAFDYVQLIGERKPYALISYDTLAARHIFTEDGTIAHKSTKAEGDTVFPWVKLFDLVDFDMMALDEAHAIKNPDAWRTKAVLSLKRPPHIIPVTASPIMNRTEELWTLLKLVAPHIFKNHSAFLASYTDGRGGVRNVKELHELLRPHFLRRRKAEVMKDLPPINRIQRFHDLTPRAQKLYDKALAGIYEQLATFNPKQAGTEMSIFSMLAQITRLKQICAADKVPFTAEIAQELIEQANGDGGKVLIFTHFKGTAVAIAEALGDKAVCTVIRRDDDTDYSMNAVERDAVFEKARYSPSIRYVVTTEAAREGHNIEYCKWVIFNDPFWTPASHYQAEGRAYGRLNDPHPIDSYYIVAETQIEQWMMELLDRKLEIFNQVVEGVEASRELSGSIGAELIKRIREAMWTQAGDSK